MRRGARVAGWCALALLASGCTDPPGGGSLGRPDPEAPWRTSTDPVQTSGLVWAADHTVRLADGTAIELGDQVKAFVVAGDGVYFFPAEDEGDVADADISERELLFADRDGSVANTGLQLMTRSLRASPDGRYLAAIDLSSGRQDRFGTPVATLLVLDLSTGEEVVRSSVGMGDPDEDDLTVLYEDVEIDVAAITDERVYVETASGVVVHDFVSGEAVPLPDGEDPPVTPDFYDSTQSPDGEWRIVRTRGLGDRLARSGGEPVTPRTGTDRWVLSWWLDDRTVVGTAVSGPGRGTRITPRDTTALMTCVVPSGECDVVEESTGKSVVFPNAASWMAGVVLQDGAETAP